ncbi:MAG: hypothetical protein IK022_06350 [Bacteroidales bacterium]|nr:hypothetical protein [Bacteroidales bacterium]
MLKKRLNDGGIVKMILYLGYDIIFVLYGRTGLLVGILFSARCNSERQKIINAAFFIRNQ